MRSFLVACGSVLIAAVVISSCGSHGRYDSSQESAAVATRLGAPDAARAPDPQTGQRHGFVPLELGDRWRYRYTFTGTLVSDPNGAPLYRVSGEYLDEIACEEVVAGLHYVVSRRLFNGDVNTPGWTRYRQDRGGLYVRDFEDHEPPPCDAGPTPRPGAVATPAERMPALERFATRLPGGAGSAAAWSRAYATLVERHEQLLHLARDLGARRAALREIQQLAYPLVPGRNWIIRDDPRFAARVERAVVVRLGRGSVHGWSIRIRSELFGAQDVVHVFWGRAGYLGLEAVYFADATDESGNIIGTIRTHEAQLLTELHLVGAGHDDVPVSFGGIQ